MSRTLLIAALSLAAPLAGRAAAHPPWGIAVDRQGRFYFADIDHGNHIWRIEAPGKLDPLRSWGAGEINGNSLWWAVG